MKVKDLFQHRKTALFFKGVTLFFGFVLFLLGLTSVYAETLLVVTDGWDASPTSMSDSYGIRCEILQDVSITQINLHPSSTCNSCGIINVSDNSLIASGTASGGHCSISADLYSGNSYYFVENEDFQSCFGTSNDATTYPIADSYISCNAGVYDVNGLPYGYTANTNYIWGVENITYSIGEVGDTTPPVINTIYKNPLNFTLNLTDYDVILKVNITDETSLNYSSVYVNLSTNWTRIFVNGSLYNPNQTLSYNNYTGNEFTFEIDETDFLSASYPLPFNVMETTPHLNDTLDTVNKFVKMAFYNISNDRRQSFIEIYDEQSEGVTGFRQYYYCNSNYTTGNILASPYCTLFYSELNTNGVGHIHSKYSKHRVIPLGINTVTGTINDIYVTPTSYIIKRGIQGGELYFYVPNISRLTQSQYTQTSGNTWSNIAGTIDSHIHQIHDNPLESFSLQIYASDNSSNQAKSNKLIDYIDFINFPPNAVQIYSPIQDSYNSSILINHSESLSISAFDITGYKYEYALEGSNTFFEIVENNYPDTFYNWNIENIANGNYYLKITVTDSYNLTTIQYSEIFTINNPLTIDQQLLTSLNENLEELSEGIDMIGVYIFIAILIFAGILTKMYFLWSVSGIGFGYLYFRYGDLFLLSGSEFHKALTFGNLILAIVFILLGVIIQIMNYTSYKKSFNKDMYDDFY